MISLDTGDPVGNKIGHHTVDRTAIIAAVTHGGLERRYVRSITKQLVARLEIIIHPRTPPRKIIGLIHVRHLMEPSPVVSLRQRIDGVEKRIVIGRERDGRDDQTENEN